MRKHQIAIKGYYVYTSPNNMNSWIIRYLNSEVAQSLCINSKAGLFNVGSFKNEDIFDFEGTFRDCTNEEIEQFKAARILNLPKYLKCKQRWHEGTGDSIVGWVYDTSKNPVFSRYSWEKIMDHPDNGFSDWKGYFHECAPEEWYMQEGISPEPKIINLFSIY